MSIISDAANHQCPRAMSQRTEKMERQSSKLSEVPERYFDTLSNILARKS